MMNKFKKISATFAAIVMSASCVACGSVDKDATSTKSFTSFSDAFDAASDFTQGSYSMEVKSSDKDAFVLSGKTDGKGLTLDAINITSGATTFTLNDALTVTPERAYINADSLLSLAGVDSELGYYGILMPEQADAADNIQTDLISFEKGFIEATFADCDVTADGHTVSVKVDTKDEFKSVATNAVNYILDNETQINNLVTKCSDSFDTKTYFTALINDIYPDLSEAYFTLTGNAFEDVVTSDELIESINTYSDEASAETSGWADSLREVKTELDGLTDADWDERYAEIDGSYVEVSVTVDGDVLSVTGNVNMVSKTADDLMYDATDETAADTTDTGADTITFGYTFTKGEVTITAPEKVTSLKGIATYFVDNPDALSSISDKISGMTSSLMTPTYNEDQMYTDDYDIVHDN